MQGVSTAFRGLADVLETVGTVGTDGADYEITTLTPCADDLIRSETISVELGVRIPFLSTDGAAPQLALTPQNVELNDDGSLQLEVMVAASADQQKQEPNKERQTDTQSGPTRDEELDTTSPRPSPSAEATTTTPETSEGDTETTAEDATESPAYRDPDRLEAVYNEYDTFGEMTDALDVDVTPQTVRRYMIKYGIHEPASNTGSQTAERLLNIDAESVSMATTEAAQEEERETASMLSPGQDQHQDTNPQVATDGKGAPGDLERTTDSETQSHIAADQTPNEETDDTATDTTEDPIDNTTSSGESPKGEGEATTVRDSENESPTASINSELSEDDVDVDLPDHLTLDDIKTTVQDSQTLYEAQQHLDLDRDQTRSLLQDLNLLDLVHGRAATRNFVSRTIEDINQRLQSESLSRPDAHQA